MAQSLSDGTSTRTLYLDRIGAPDGVGRGGMTSNHVRTFELVYNSCPPPAGSDPLFVPTLTLSEVSSPHTFAQIETLSLCSVCGRV